MRHVELGDPNGEPLVFLHGGNVAGWMWGPQVDAFADYRVLVPDLPGFGASAAEPWNGIAAAADGVAALLPAPAHVVGLSLGSSVAAALAARHPTSVRTLFLASAQALPPSRGAVRMGRLMLRFWERRWFWSALARGYGLRGDDARQLIDTGLGIRRETATAVFEGGRAWDARRQPAEAQSGRRGGAGPGLGRLPGRADRGTGDRPGRRSSMERRGAGALQRGSSHVARRRRDRWATQAVPKPGVGFGADDHH